MYNVSNKYILAMQEPTIQSKLRIVLDEEELTESHILAGSFSISNQCTDTSNVVLGSVYIAELEVTFLRNVSVARNYWIGKTIKPYYQLKVDEDEWEEVPLGVYTISEATHSASGTEVKAYDNMSLLDKNLHMDTTTGTPYALLSMMADTCHVTLGNTQAEVEALLNGNETLSVYAPNDLKTWRDLIAEVAEVCGCFCYADRNGDITLKRLYTSSYINVDTYHRFKGAKVSDYTTYYSGVSIVNMKTEKTEYYGDLYDDTGTTMNLGQNPLLQYGTKNHREEMIRRILAEIELYRYVPCEASLTAPFCCYDLGDVITFTDGLAGLSSAVCIMRYEFARAEFEIRCYGADPQLANARSKVDKDISGLLANAEQDKYVVYSFKNAEAITIPDGQIVRVINLRIASITDTDVVFHGEVLCNELVDNGKAKVHYKLNGSEINYHPEETWVDGKHILSLMYKMDITSSSQYQFEVLIESIDGDIEIGAGEANGIISGIGLVASNKWTGYLDFQERIGRIELDHITVKPFTDTTFSAVVQIPTSGSYTDDFGAIALDTDIVTVKGFTEALYFNKYPLHEHYWREIQDDTWAEVEDTYFW